MELALERSPRGTVAFAAQPQSVEFLEDRVSADADVIRRRTSARALVILWLVFDLFGCGGTLEALA